MAASHDGEQPDLEDFLLRPQFLFGDQALHELEPNFSQICEMLLYEGLEAYKKDGPKFMQRLIAKQKVRTK